jgi:hypothetical protein
MSPENQGVFKLLKKVAFRGILVFYNSRKWGRFGGICTWLGALWLAGGTGPEDFGRQQSTSSQFVMSIVHIFQRR